MNPLNFLNDKFLGNTIESYVWFFGILLLGLILKKFLTKIITRTIYSIFRRYGKSVGAEQFLNLMNRPFQLFIMIGIFYFAFDRLVFPTEWKLVPENQFGIRLVIFRLFEGAIVFSITWIALRTIDFIGLIFLVRAQKTESKMDDQLVTFAKEAVKVIGVVIGFFVLIGLVFNLNVVSLVTGLGIGGLAFALAAKETLENLLGSFTLFIDKPFVVGDSIRVGSTEGKVESIGFRSTRIRALDRMIVIVPNKKMTDAELINDTERISRRANFTIGLVYQTTEAQLRTIIKEIRNVLREQELIEPEPIVRFKTFGPSSIEIVIIFHALTPAMADFLKLQEEINFSIMNIVKRNGSDFSYPTSVFYLKKEDNNPEKSSAE